MTPAELEKQKVAQKALRGDGVSMQTHVAMKEAGVGPYEGRPAPAPAAPVPYSQGQDNSTITDFKTRQHSDRAKAAGLPATASPDEVDRVSLQQKLRGK